MHSALKATSVLLMLTIFSIIAISLNSEVKAAAACSGTITPTNFEPNVNDLSFVFTPTNDGDVNLKWFKLAIPLEGMTIKGFSLSGWTKSYDSGTRTITISSGSGLGPSENLNFNMTFDIGDIAGQSGNWTVTASENTDGSSPFSCSGSYGATVSGGSDVTAPVISGITVSNISSSGATVAWTTNEAASSLVKYDVNANFGTYPFSHSNATLKTSHSIAVSNSIAASTTYYYVVCSTDEAGNEACSSENAFTTSAAATSAPAATAAPTTAATAAPTTAATAAPTATPFVDRVKPNIDFTTEFENSYEQAPLIEGEATDSIGVTSIDFSTDGGANWLPVDDTEGLGEKSATFSFTPQIFEDGNYEVQVRARDAAGNTGTTDIVTVIIDRLPPRVGGNLLTLGPLPLIPNEDGVIITIPGLEQRITMSAVGGATSVDLLVNNSISSLGFSPQLNLWTGALNLSEPGTYELTTRARDGAGNETERKLNTVVVVEPGEVVMPDSGKIAEEGEVTAFVRDPVTRLWSKWNAETFGQENPQDLVDGSYSFFLPPGTYYMVIKADGAPKLTTKIFQVTSARPMNSDFKLLERKVLQVGPIRIPLPDIFSDKVDVVIKNPNTASIAKEGLIGKDLPNFTLPSTAGEFSSSILRGDRAIVSFINTWSPPAVEQLSILNAYYNQKPVSHAIIASQESESKILVFQKRGKYELDIVIDKDGELIEDYNLTSLPKHYFVDRRGEIHNIITGVLNESELDQYLGDI